jgi:hypothetical protein
LYIINGLTFTKKCWQINNQGTRLFPIFTTYSGMLPELLNKNEAVQQLSGVGMETRGRAATGIALKSWL